MAASGSCMVARRLLGLHVRRTLNITCEAQIREASQCARLPIPCFDRFMPLLDRPFFYVGTSSSLVPRPAVMSRRAFWIRRRNSGWCSRR